MSISRNAHHPDVLVRRICWNVPNLAWSMDPCEYRQYAVPGDKVYQNHMRLVLHELTVSEQLKRAPFSSRIK